MTCGGATRASRRSRERSIRSTTQAFLAVVHERLGDHDAARAAIELSDKLGAAEDMGNYAITHAVRARLALADEDGRPPSSWAHSAVDNAFLKIPPSSKPRQSSTSLASSQRSGAKKRRARRHARHSNLFKAKGDGPGRPSTGAPPGARLPRVAGRVPDAPARPASRRNYAGPSWSRQMSCPIQPRRRCPPLRGNGRREQHRARRPSSRRANQQILAAATRGRTARRPSCPTTPTPVPQPWEQEQRASRCSLPEADRRLPLCPDTALNGESLDLGFCIHSGQGPSAPRRALETVPVLHRRPRRAIEANGSGLVVRFEERFDQLEELLRLLELRQVAGAVDELPSRVRESGYERAHDARCGLFMLARSPARARGHRRGET